MTGFTSKVQSGEQLNIPDEFAEINDIEHEDLLEVEIVKHKKSNGDVKIDKTKDES